MKHRKKMYLCMAVLIFIMLLSGCKNESVSSSDITAYPETKVTLEPTVTPELIVTPEPTIAPEPTATPEPKPSLEDMINTNGGRLLINGEIFNALYGETGALIWRRVEATFDKGEHYLLGFVAPKKLSEKMSLIDVEQNMYCTSWIRWSELTYHDFSIKSIGEDMYEVKMSVMRDDYLYFVNGREMEILSTYGIGIPQIYREDEKYELYDINRLNQYNSGKVMVQASYKYYRSGYDKPNESEYIWIDKHGKYKVIENSDIFYRRYNDIQHNGNYYDTSGMGSFSDGVFYYEGVFYDYNLNVVLDLREAGYTPYADKDVYTPEFINGVCKMLAYKNGKFWLFDINKKGEMITEAEEFNIEMLWAWLDVYEQWRKENKEEQGNVSDESNSKEIHVVSHLEEVPRIVQKYLDMHPELGYTMKETIISNYDYSYEPALDEMLEIGDAPDIYALDAEFVLKYTQGDESEYAATYDELGLATTQLIKESKTARYAVEIGTRLSDNEVVALPYQSTSGCFIYRRSIAKTIWGTDDPEVVAEKIGGGTGNWNQFWVAAEELKTKGYGIISGDDDIWRVIENSADKGWVVDGKLYIDPKREAFLDISMKLRENDYHNETWWNQDIWYADMTGKGEKEVLGFFGPAWLINRIIENECRGRRDDWLMSEENLNDGLYGDWAVTTSPVGFFWGGTWVASSKHAVQNMSEEKKKVVADIIQWITLDYDENSLQYMWANGTLFPEEPTKDTVVSGAVMEKVNGTVDILGGQNMNEYYLPANEQTSGNNLTQYDQRINYLWREAALMYVDGYISRKEAIKSFKEKVGKELNIIVSEDYEETRNLHGMEIIIGDHFSPETPAEPMNAKERAIWKYRQEIFQKYNFTMQSKFIAGWGDDMKNTYIRSTLAGEPKAQLFELDCRFVADGLKNRCFYDLATLEELDFSEDKWNKSVLNIMTIGNSIYGMSAEKSIPRGGVIWNKRLFEEAGLDPDLPYDLQASGEWTWSKFIELCKRLTRDVDGDGVTDIYATASQNSSLITCLVASTGSDFFVKDKNGTIVNNMNSNEVLSALDFAVELYNKGYEMPQPSEDDWDYFQEAFREGKAAMQFNEEYICSPSYDDYRPDDEIGFVMPPKPDGAAAYHSYVSNNITVIPSCYDAETAGNIAFAYNLYTMTLPEYDDTDDWKKEYYNHFHFNDKRAVDETIVMFNDGVSTHYLTQALVPGDLWDDLFVKYPFKGTTPKETVEAISKEWETILNEVNRRD